MTRAAGRNTTDLLMVAEGLASVDDGASPHGPASRLGVALVGLAQDLAAARREIVVLKRENAALRSRLNGKSSHE